MLIYNGDPVMHQPPDGWRFAVEDPLMVNDLDAELWTLRRAT